MNGLQSDRFIENTTAADFLESLDHEETEHQRHSEGLQKLRCRINQYAVNTCLIERLDDAFLMRFLRARRFEVDDSFELLCQYHEFRRNNPSLFENVSAYQLHHIVEDGLLCVLPYNNANHSTIMVIFAGGWDKDTYGTEEILKAMVLTIELLTENEQVQSNGIVVIADFSGWTTAQASHLTIHFIRRVCEIFQDHFPVKVLGIHFVNEPWYLRAGLSIFKPFIKEKIWKRIHVHGNNMATVHSHFHPDVLPAEFGGNKPEVDRSYWANILLDSEKKQIHYVYGDNPFRWSVNLRENLQKTNGDKISDEFHVVHV